MLLLSLSLLLNYYAEEKNIEYLLLKQKWKNVPNRSAQWFKRIAWFVGQILLYIIWNGIAGSWICLNPNVGKCLGICSLPEYVWNIAYLNMSESAKIRFRISMNCSSETSNTSMVQ